MLAGPRSSLSFPIIISSVASDSLLFKLCFFIQTKIREIEPPLIYRLQPINNRRLNKSAI